MSVKKLFSVVLIVLFMGACTTDWTDNDTAKLPNCANKIINSSDNACGGALLVKLNSYTDTFTVEEVDGVKVDCRPLFPTDNVADAELQSEELYRWWVLSFDQECNLDALAQRVAEDSLVQYVEFNEIMEQLGQDNQSDEHVEPLTATRATSADMPFNDEYLFRQWNFYNDGTDNGVSSTLHSAGADINLFPAWEYCTGDERVIVAVIDGGVKHSHPDLEANMWVNEDEIPNNGIDDDKNGYIDDIHGYNFNDNCGDIYFDSHGTHVAGTIAAVSNNGIGVSGIAGGSGSGDGCRIMTCQIYKDGDAASTQGIANAIKYAADNGAVIINNSWAYGKGAYTSDSRFMQSYSVLMNTIDYFERNAKLPGVIDGGISIFAAGNSSYGVPSYPGAYYSNICVTAFGPNFTAASYTNYGAGANICAPGGESNGSSVKICSTSTDEYEYSYDKGTSMATPHVSGCAALGLSYALKIGKSFTREEYRNIILSSVHDIDQYQTVREGVFDFDTGTYPTVNIEYYKGKLGAGYIDAHLLLMQVEGTPCVYISADRQESVSLDNYFGGASETLTYTGVAMSSEDMSKLGITSTPSIADGKLQIKCTKCGTARISVTAIVGGSSVGGGDNMGGMEVTREFELVVRRSVAENGGWL